MSLNTNDGATVCGDLKARSRALLEMKSPTFARRVRKERKRDGFSENRCAVEPRIGPQGVLGLGAGE
ncbi:hypothetical protein PVK06_010564 [Gossypium arboreum]|uniref:Uncharacterized protein n=1 Tax=Gossypium arboreum TaxID=29729 RepID=A0ABR0Q6I4_GOSAR|nr:hypothetical protein PVK06_010564 [Gossypium arboreum]